MPLDPRDCGAKRSDKWPSARKAWLKNNPACAACGSKKKITVHHKMPFHLDRNLELDPTNFITLCETPDHNCHLMFGHLLSWKSFNAKVEADTATMLERITDRPKP